MIYFKITGLLLLLLTPLSLAAQDSPEPKTTSVAGQETDGAPELTEAADKAIERGLQFLLKSQNKNGSWTGENGATDIGGTSLALMAFKVK